MVVEASLVFPIIFLAIIAVIYICILLYQKAYIQSLADMTVNRGCATWSNPEKDTAFGGVDKTSLGEGGLYWRLFDLKRPERVRKLEEYIESRQGAFSILGSTADTSIEVRDYIVYKKLTVSIEDRYRIPMGGLLRVFGLGEDFTVSSRAEAVINEPVEFIRNTDFIMDLGKELEKDYPAYGKLVQEIRETMSEIGKKAGELKHQ